jgi:hypothetical protein
VTSYHINSKGNPGVCKATQGGCPFGEASDHFATAAEARNAFENSSSADKIPSTKKKSTDITSFDPATQTLFSNKAARRSPDVAVKALKREAAHGDWLRELEDRYSDDPATKGLKDDAAAKAKESDARLAAMLQEVKYLADNDTAYAERTPAAARRLMASLTPEIYAGVPIGTVRKA